MLDKIIIFLQNDLKIIFTLLLMASNNSIFVGLACGLLCMTVCYGQFSPVPDITPDPQIITSAPTLEPTYVPVTPPPPTTLQPNTPEPTEQPTDIPTNQPTNSPTLEPTEEPSLVPQTPEPIITSVPTGQPLPQGDSSGSSWKMPVVIVTLSLIATVVGTIVYWKRNLIKQQLSSNTGSPGEAAPLLSDTTQPSADNLLRQLLKIGSIQGRIDWSPGSPSTFYTDSARDFLDGQLRDENRRNDFIHEFPGIDQVSPQSICSGAIERIQHGIFGGEFSLQTMQIASIPPAFENIGAAEWKMLSCSLRGAVGNLIDCVLGNTLAQIGYCFEAVTYGGDNITPYSFWQMTFYRPGDTSYTTYLDKSPERRRRLRQVTFI